MSKVLIDRELLEGLIEQYITELGYTNATAHHAQKAMEAPSGTPAMPVKAYYHEAPNEYGGFNKSVGLEVRKAFADAHLVLEADALGRIACLEGEIAKRDEELAACRVAVENCDVFRARIAELEARIVWLECEAQVNAAPVSEAKAQGEYGDAYQGAREDLAIWKRRALEAEKALQEERIITERLGNALNEENGPTFMGEPVFPAKAQGVVLQSTDGGRNPRYEGLFDGETEEQRASRLNATHVQQVSVPAWMASSRAFADRLYMAGWRDHADAQHSGVAGMYDELLSSAPAAPAADAGLVDMYRHLQTVTPYRFKKIQDASVTDGGDVLYFHKDRFDAALLDDMAANCAKESK